MSSPRKTDAVIEAFATLLIFLGIFGFAVHSCDKEHRTKRFRVCAEKIPKGESITVCDKYLE